MQPNNTADETPAESIDKLHFYLPGLVKRSAEPGPVERFLADIRESYRG